MASFISLLDLVYPVGSYYMSNSSGSPASKFGGTWTQLTDSRVPIGANSVSTGGSSTHTHRYGLEIYPVRAMLTFNPSQSTDSNLIKIENFSSSSSYTLSGTTSWGETSWYGRTNDCFVPNKWKDSGATAAISHVYANVSHGSSYPPYRSCYMYYRTA